MKTFVLWTENGKCFSRLIYSIILLIAHCDLDHIVKRFYEWMKNIPEHVTEYPNEKVDCLRLH